ncbi:Hypothetical protein CINCED_3A000715 [Cinara cedri]|nr:Hypothetical protein CINCED_3A000715 [Cinara cedri]
MSSKTKDTVSVSVTQPAAESKKHSNFAKRRVVYWYNGLKLAKLKKFIFYLLIVAISCAIVYTIYGKIYHEDPSVAESKEAHHDHQQNLPDIKLGVVDDDVSKKTKTIEINIKKRSR